MGKALAQMVLNATNMSVLLNNLTTGVTYQVRVAAFTRAGMGPFSTESRLWMDPSALTPNPRSRSTTNTASAGSGVLREPWFALLLGTMALAVVGAFLAVIYLKKRQAAAKELGHIKGAYDT